MSWHYFSYYAVAIYVFFFSLVGWSPVPFRFVVMHKIFVRLPQTIGIGPTSTSWEKIESIALLLLPQPNQNSNIYIYLIVIAHYKRWLSHLKTLVQCALYGYFYFLLLLFTLFLLITGWASIRVNGFCYGLKLFGRYSHLLSESMSAHRQGWEAIIGRRNRKWIGGQQW